MNKSFPKKVFLREDGPREGFQMHKEIVPTEKKIELINALSETGITSIEVTSFVRPDLLPQQADAKEVADGISPKKGIRYRGLYLNKKGFERAIACKKLDIEGYIHLSPSDHFLKRNNNTSLKVALDQIPNWLELFSSHNKRLERIMLSTAFGNHEEGKTETKDVVSVIEQALTRIHDAGQKLEEFTLADTTGFANPESVKTLVAEIKSKWPKLELGLHLHDTRGTGIANVYAGLSEGVTRFDCSVGGLGGCPFTKGAAGNVPTEDVAYLCEELGIETGVDLKRYIKCAKLAENIVGHKLPGKLKDSELF